MPQSGLNHIVEGDAIWDNVKSLNAAAADLTPGEESVARNYWRAISQQINSHFQEYAKVLPGTLALTPSQILDGENMPCSGDGILDTGIGAIE